MASFIGEDLLDNEHTYLIHLWPVARQIYFWEILPKSCDSVRPPPPPGWSKRPTFAVFLLRLPLHPQLRENYTGVESTRLWN